MPETAVSAGRPLGPGGKACRRPRPGLWMAARRRVPTWLCVRGSCVSASAPCPPGRTQRSYWVGVRAGRRVPSMASAESGTAPWAWARGSSGSPGQRMRPLCPRPRSRQGSPRRAHTEWCVCARPRREDGSSWAPGMWTERRGFVSPGCGCPRSRAGAGATYSQHTRRGSVQRGTPPLPLPCGVSSSCVARPTGHRGFGDPSQLCRGRGQEQGAGPGAGGRAGCIQLPCRRRPGADSGPAHSPQFPFCFPATFQTALSTLIRRSLLPVRDTRMGSWCPRPWGTRRPCTRGKVSGGPVGADRGCGPGQRRDSWDHTFSPQRDFRSFLD